MHAGTLGARSFFSRWGATELSGEVAKASLEGARKNITNSQNDQLPNGLIAQLEKHGIGIAEVKIKHSSRSSLFAGLSLKVLKGVHVTYHCVTIQTIHVSNMLARDSVILLILATKMVKIYLFTSSLVRFRRIEAKKYSRLSRIGIV